MGIVSDKRKPQTLHRKLFLARKAAEAVAKNGESVEGDFTFARFEDVLAEASERLESKGILVLPQVIDEKLSFSTSGFAIATVVMEFEVVDTTGGESLTRRWSGTGHDSPGDKALFKAQTGCEKYFLAKLLGIPFGTDPEADADRPSASPEADRIRTEQDAASEPESEPDLRPLPESDLPEVDWTEEPQVA